MSATADEADPGRSARENALIMMPLCGTPRLGARLGDDERVETEGILVDAPVGLCERDGLLSDHDDLPHVLALPVRIGATAEAPRACSCSKDRPHAAELSEWYLRESWKSTTPAHRRNAP
jgi:hypothetical protein